MSDAIVHVIDGMGLFALNDGRVVDLSKNDQVHIAVCDAYYFEGNLEIMYAASPEWNPKQAEPVC